MTRLQLLIAVSCLGTTTLSAQLPNAQAADTLPRASWISRLGVTMHTGPFQPRGDSEAFRLFDAALTKGTDALTPRMTGASLHVRLWRTVRFVGRFEGGARTVASQSLVALPGIAPAAQRTRFELPSVASAGLEVVTWRWRRGSRDMLRVIGGAGIGRARYTLRQWGDFVDEDRLVQFRDDLVSEGRGTIYQLRAGVEAPVTRHAALVLDLQRQFGTAPMDADFARFNALDLGGTRFGVGVHWAMQRAW